MATAAPAQAATSAPASAPASTLPAATQAAPIAAAVGDEAPGFDALLFTKTEGYRHPNIPTGIAAIQDLGEQHGFEVTATEDATVFTEENLANYDVVIFFSTTGNVLDATQEAAFEQYIQNGGGYAGIHAASDTEYDWEWYGGLVGAYFDGHPPGTPNADVLVEDFAHPSTEHLPAVWNRTDEWYSFGENPREDVHVLASLDEDTYSVGNLDMGDHPIAWCHNYDGGRSWYTGGGHTGASFSEPEFLSHVLEGIRTAAGVVPSDCNATDSDAYELVPLDEDTRNPMSLNVAQDGTVFYLERNGELLRIDPETNQTSTALNLNVTNGNEDGLLGMVLDPEFETNNHAFIYWSPANVGTDGPHNRISRFTYDPVSGTFDPSSETLIMMVETQRDECCHAGGDMVFDLDGNLVLATGDNTNPFDSSGYSPIDERAGRSAWDAQRTSANTNDLRGKVLRITPLDEGGYEIPEGNLFDEADDTADETRPEIYAMGFRNPFRIGLDPYSGAIVVGDYGPDAGSANPNRGPAGTTEWNIVDEPGNYGWPYCHGVKCYNDWNFANNTSGPQFDPAGPTNDSPNNTGMSVLPPVIYPEYYGERGAQDNPFPIVGSNGYTGAPMGGDVYKYDPDLVSDTKFPAYWDGKAFLGDWNNGEAFVITMTDERDDITTITPLLPGLIADNPDWDQVMDAQWGPDGSLYIIDWGVGYGTNNPGSGIYRVDYVEGNPSPIARASADVTNGAGDELTVNFSSEGTRHPALLDYTLEWNFGDGATSTEADPTHTYTEQGDYTAQLTVTDENGLTATANVRIVVGNAAPTVTIDFPEQGGFFTWGDEVEYQVTVTDPDGEVVCENVDVLPALGHAAHQHPSDALTGCTGVIPTIRDEGHGITEDIFWVVDVSYTDDGGEVGVPLQASNTNILNPKRLEAEFFDATGVVTEEFPGNTGAGVDVEDNGDLDQGQNVSNIEPGDWWSYEPINFKGVDGMRARLASLDSDGTISIRWNAPDGDEIGEIDFTATGDWQDYEYFDATLGELPSESGELYFVLMSGGVNVNYFEWIGDGVDGNSVPDLDLQVDTVTGTAPLTVNATATASDPEGEDVTLEWNQGTGEGFVAGTEAESFTYDTPGQYVLRVRAYDESGIFNEEYVQITVEGAAQLCFDGRSDDFTGDALDTDRWNRSVRIDQSLSVADGHLIIPATQTDIYQNSGDDTPNIVLQDLPAGAWEATTKVSIEARNEYQQAGLVVYGDDDNYAKMVIQARDASAANRVFQFARETNGTTPETNTPALGAGYPDTVWVRLTSDGTTLTASYSDDGNEFTTIGTTYPMGDIVDPKIGLLALAGADNDDAIVNAEFDWFYITPDDTASDTGPNDEFDGDSLNACRWTVENEDASAYRVTDGMLEIDPAAGDIYQDGTGVTNFVMQQMSGDWTVETKVDTSELTHQYQQGGLIARADDDNYVKLDLVATNAVGGNKATGIEILSEVDGNVTAGAQQLSAPANGIVWLRMTKTGDVFTGSMSADGETWTDFPDQMTNAGAAAANKVGPFALGTNNQTVTPTVYFDYFRKLGTEVEPIELDVTVSPETADGDNDWYVSPVTVTATTTGGGESTVYREYRIDGGDWSEYTAPVEVATDGEHTVDVRASGSGAEPVEESVSFKIDTTVPTVDIEIDFAEQPRTLVLTAEDDGSGVDAIEYRINGGNWMDYTDEVDLTDDAQTIRARAFDEAGNLSATANSYVPAYGSGAFVDVNHTNTEFYTEILWLASRGITRGWEIAPDVFEFRPENEITRDAMAAFLYRYAGEPEVDTSGGSPFVDVTPSNTEFYEEILWLAEQGITLGWDTPRGQEFRPESEITRDAMAAFLYRYAGEPEWDAPEESPFLDITEDSTEFYTEITWLADTGITRGWEVDGGFEFRPFNETTRDAMAAFLYRFHLQFGPTEEVEPLELSVTVSPAEPDGGADWYTSSVTVDATATGGGEAGAQLAISLDGGDWVAFTEAVEVSEDGEHTAEVRATNPDTATVTESVSFKIDGTAPTASIDTELSSEPRTFTVTGDDEASGVELLEYQIDGGEWTEFTADVELSNAAQTITARATDAAGNQSDVASTDIPEYVPSECDEVVSPNDEFEGDALDDCRWTIINEDDTAYRVTGGNLEIDTSSADIYEGGSGVTNFVVQDLEGDWTVETAVDVSTIDRQYQQAGLIALADDDNYVKIDYLAVNQGGQALDTNIEMRSEIGGEVQTPQPNLDATLEDGMIWFRLSKTGDVFSGAYSVDGETWVPFAEEFTNAVAAAGQVGVYALGHPNQGSESRTVAFDYFTVVGDEPVCLPDDQFDGDSLEECRWTVVNEDANAYRVADGFLEIDTAPTDIYGTNNSTVTNFVVQELEGDWTVETMVDTSELVHQYQQAGLIARADDDNYVKLDLVVTNAVGGARDVNMEFRSEIGGTVQNPQPNIDVAAATGDVWLRLTKTGNVFSGSFSVDGETWTPFTPTHTNAAAAAGPVGLYTLGTSNQTVTPTVRFDYFSIAQ
ncbi:ThuA domain-containing protein [Demequina sp. NBRC 110053]|uniref:ThuA domain-containing protein n=1 Tax=Demequina sp. NBRC 110053 TaxID=1570342 RepID=UPI0009FD2599|nr:ThuA domain-containing protein [Demequina sp. NBRC 110053]